MGQRISGMGSKRTILRSLPGDSWPLLKHLPLNPDGVCLTLGLGHCIVIIRSCLWSPPEVQPLCPFIKHTVSICSVSHWEYREWTRHDSCPLGAHSLIGETHTVTNTVWWITCPKPAVSQNPVIWYSGVNISIKKKKEVQAWGKLGREKPSWSQG